MLALIKLMIVVQYVTLEQALPVTELYSLMESVKTTKSGFIVIALNLVSIMIFGSNEYKKMKLLPAYCLNHLLFFLNFALQVW